MTGRSSTTDTGAKPRTGLFRSRLRDARIRSKLGLILIIPLVAVVALAGVRLVDSGQRAIAAEQVRSLTAVAVEVAEVANNLHLERVEAARLLTDPDGDAGLFNARSVVTDDAVARYQAARAELGDIDEVVSERLERVDLHLDGLGIVRQQILSEAPITVSAAMVRYGVILTDALAYLEAVGQVADDPALAEEIRAVAAISRAKTFAAEAEAIALVALEDGVLTEEELTVFLATQTGQQEAFQAFGQSATPAQRSVANRAITGGNVVFADRAAAAMLRSSGGELDLAPTTVASSFRGMVTATRWVEEQLQAQLLVTATERRDTVFQQVLVESIGVLLALVIAITFAVVLARMLARSLLQLRQEALHVAERELPDTVARLSDPASLGENTPDELAAQVREPIQMRSRDEIGQVAQAFNAVHRAAVRVAAEQAALRTSVSAMFLSLARRSQSLVDRMIRQLDEIERNEEDPKRLARMFVLDHLATRMRRNDENLLVLAGADSSPPRTDDALVVDVLRAAQSEVEHYDRIEFGTVDADVAVVAAAVNDVVRLIAELFDNATRFSPPTSPVVAEARRLGDQMIVQIEDRGLGMSQEQANRINAWLASPPAVEVTTFRRMGLAVVARLAARHQIRVELRCDPSFGTVAYVALPRSILILPQSRLRAAPMMSRYTPPQLEAATAAPPPMPARHIGVLPRRTPAAAHQAAARPATADEDTRMDLPVAGRPLYGTPQPVTPTPVTPVTQPAPAPAQAPLNPAPVTSTVPEPTVELPIFQEMEAVWFRSHGKLDLGAAATGYQQPAAASYQPAATPSQPTGGPQGGPVSYQPPTPPPAQPSSAGPTEWRTAADAGWQAAAAAARPTSGGSTKSGLPKRVPQAQLVPGSVETRQPTVAHRRSPDEIRGLLSAYHRGVQRGRATGAHPH